MQKARRAAPDVNGIDSQAHRPTNPGRFKERGVVTNFAANGLDIGRKAGSGHYAGVEVAIGAFGLAERHLDVGPRCLHR